MTAAGKDQVTDSGADVVLPKPFDVVAMEARLQRFLA
jgi:hypothetical protein